MMTSPRSGWSEAVCGMTWGWPGPRGSWSEGEKSMATLATLGVNWVTLAFAVEQSTAQSTEIPFEGPEAMTDDEIRLATSWARAHDLKICLKPMVNCSDGTWRAYIGFLDPAVPGEPSWDEWFSSYRAYMRHHAQLAQELGIEMLCIGCEMVRSDSQVDHWRRLIAEVREEYTGLITYNCDKYQEDRIEWWDAVDVISTSGYYPIDSWEQNLDRIATVVEAHDKPFLFMEAGCPSRQAAGLRPNVAEGPEPVDLTEQALFLETMLDAGRRHPWVGGFMLWDWPATLYAESCGATDTGYCLYGKPAFNVVKRQYKELLHPNRTPHTEEQAVGYLERDASQRCYEAVIEEPGRK